MSYAFPILFVATLVGEVSAAANWWEPLIGSGPIGVVLLWFMWRNEKKLTSNTNAIDTNTLSTIIAVLAIQHGDSALAKLAAQIKEQVEKRKANEDANR